MNTIQLTDKQLERLMEYMPELQEIKTREQHENSVNVLNEELRKLKGGTIYCGRLGYKGNSIVPGGIKIGDGLLYRNSKLVGITICQLDILAQEAGVNLIIEVDYRKGGLGDIKIHKNDFMEIDFDRVCMVATVVDCNGKGWRFPPGWIGRIPDVPVTYENTVIITKKTSYLLSILSCLV